MSDSISLLIMFALGVAAGIVVGLVAARRRSAAAADPAPVVAQAPSASTLEADRLARQLAERTRELEAANAKLTTRDRVEQSITLSDPLTGIANRTLLTERIDHAILRCKRNNGRFGTLMIDVNDFGTLHDRVGRAASDRLLIEIARRLRSAVRSEDTVARLVADRFGVVLEGVFEREDIERATESVMRAFSEPFTLDNEQIEVSASVSSALYPVDGEDAEALLRASEHALILSKKRRGSARGHLPSKAS